MKIFEELLLLPPNVQQAKYEIIKKYLKKDATMLEWGSGYSTIAFSKEVEYVYTVEHSLYWFNLISFLSVLLQIENLTVLGIAAENGDEDEKIKFATYINAPDILKEQHGRDKYDIVLIDGCVRNHCLEKIIPFLHDDSVVIIDDYNRDQELHHDIISESYEVIEKSEAGSALLVLKKK